MASQPMFLTKRRPRREVPPGPALQRAPASERRWGLLVEDELKTTGAILIQDAFRGLLATLFYLIASVTHDVVVYGRENITGRHPTILISNHKRDFESLVVQGIAYYGRGITRPNRGLSFALREDVFWRGFLARYIRHPLLRWLLGWIDVRPHMHFLKIFPIGHLTSRHELPRIRCQLRRFASLLEHGRDLYWTPEGGLGLDGHFGRVRAGLYRLIKESEAEPALLPLAVCYDFMTTVRTRCFVRIGPELRLDRTYGRVELERLAREAILRQMTLNVGHLMGAVLRGLPPGACLSRAELEDRVRAQGRRLRDAGLYLDPRLTVHASFRRRVGHFLGYAERHGILRREGQLWRKQLGEQHPEMRYALNELADLEPLLS